MVARRLVMFSSALLLVATIVACGNGGGATAFNHSGSWTGVINDSVAGTGSVTVSISQSGNTLLGTWQATFDAGGVNSGSLEGIIRANDVVIELYPSQAMACPYRIVAQRSGSTLSGTYVAFNCSIEISGSLSVTKQ